jgi:uncharacterized Ntn-hydrolase superfamily protein
LAHGSKLSLNHDDINTFSVVAFEPETGDLGVAVASHYFSVGAVVPWAEAGVGAIATQASVNVAFGPRGLELLRQGLGATEALERLSRGINLAQKRPPVGIIDATGNVATVTGTEAPNWAGSKQGRFWSVQGNLLVGPQVVESMGQALDSTDGELAEKLFSALKAGDEAGGDSRGRQSAAILVVGKGRGRNVNNDRPVSINVDDHDEPFVELRRLLDLNLAYLYFDRAYKALCAGNLQGASTAQVKAAAYSHPDTQLRVGL